MRFLIVLLLLQSPLVDIYHDLDVMCRGGDTFQSGNVDACSVRLKLEKLMEASGYCYGAPDQDRAHSDWHRCARQ